MTPNEITITPLDEQFIEKAIKIVEERMSDSDFSVEMLGAELGLSRSHLYKKLMCTSGKKRMLVIPKLVAMTDWK